MKLFLIWQDENNDYDTYDSVIVAAKDAHDAAYIHPSRDEKWNEESNSWVDKDTGYTGYKGRSTWASSPRNVKVTYIGEAAEGTSAGVILASFNAG